MVVGGDRAIVPWNTNSVRPDAGLSQNRGRRHDLAEDLVKQFGLNTPGVGIALIAIGRMRKWGVTITPEIAQACIGSYVKEQRRIDELTARLQLPDRTSLVYYVQTGDRVKIGFTTHLAERMATLVPERLLAVERGDPKLERSRHKQFAALRTRGEWFRYESPLTEHIAGLTDESRPDDLLDTATAAVAFGVQSSTVRKWVQRGKLSPVARGTNHRNLYRRADLEDLHARLLDE
jgi:hypothetical protein